LKIETTSDVILYIRNTAVNFLLTPCTVPDQSEKDHLPSPTEWDGTPLGSS